MTLSFAVSVAKTAHADSDFDLESDAWNGGATLVSVARAHAPRVVATSTVDLGTLGEDDALFILGPERALPEDDLLDFVRRGGRLVIADDFGSGTALFSRFGIRRSEPGATEAPRVRGESALLVARPFYAHPITEGVGFVVTNRPALLEHPRLVPLVALDDGGPGLLLTGVVGEGRVVAIGDPSIFLNAMMQLRGNRRLAENIVDFVVEGTPPRRLVLAAGTARFTGDFDPEASGPMRTRIEHQIRALARTRMPEPALRIAAVVLAMLSVVLLSTMRDARPEAMMPWLTPQSRYVGPAEARRDALRAAIELAAERRLGAKGSSPRKNLEKALATLALPSDDARDVLRAVEGRGDEDDLARAVATLDAALEERADGPRRDEERR